MAKQKINVIVNIPDSEYCRKLIAEAAADIITQRIEQFPENQRMKIWNELLKDEDEEAATQTI